jgi:hypothetical protein
VEINNFNTLRHHQRLAGTVFATMISDNRRRPVALNSVRFPMSSNLAGLPQPYTPKTKGFNLECSFLLVITRRPTEFVRRPNTDQGQRRITRVGRL